MPERVVQNPVVGGQQAPQQQPQQQQQQQQPVKMAVPPGAVEAMRKPDYVVYFEMRKNPQNPRQILVRSSVLGIGTIPLTRFTVKYGVPVGWVIQTQPPSGDRLEPGGQPIYQQFMVSSQGNVPLMMKTLVTYYYGSQPISETGEINPIFG
jgi:hypothetical protein